MPSILIATALATSCFVGQPATAPPSRGVPLAAGTVWVYKGMGKGWNGELKKTVTSQLTWQMKVERVEMRGKLVVAQVQGHPDEVAWGIPESGPASYLLIQDGPRYYRIQPEGPPIIPRTEAEVRKLLHPGDVIYEAGLKVGQEIGRDPEGSRRPGFFCWRVASTGQLALPAIKGVPTGTRVRCCTLEYRTNPDTEIVDIAEGIGIVRFRYTHHGTPAECDLRLVELRRPAK